MSVSYSRFNLLILTFSLVIVNALRAVLDCDALMISVIYKRYSCHKTREKECMAMIVCERVIGGNIAFLLVRVRGAQLSLTVSLP